MGVGGAQKRFKMLGLHFLGPECVLVVVHPDLEDMALHAHIAAEAVDSHLVLLLYPPSHLLCKRIHALLLICSEFGAEAFLGHVAASAAAGTGTHGVHTAATAAASVMVYSSKGSILVACHQMMATAGSHVRRN